METLEWTLQPRLPEEEDPTALHLKDLLKRETYTLETGKQFGKDILSDLSSRQELTNPKTRKRKIRIVLIAAGVGALCGHTYAAYRGIFRPSLYFRHVAGTSVIGMVASMPLISFSKLKDKKYPFVVATIHGSEFGAIVGFVHRGPKYILTYSMLGTFGYICAIIAWFQIIKPIYYFHYLKWPYYDPPKWWPAQHETALQVYDTEVERERLNVIFQEDLKFWQNFDEQQESKLRLQQQLNTQTTFVNQT